MASDVRERLGAFFAARAGEVSRLVVVTGLRRGAEQLAAEAAAAAGVPYVVVLPFPEPDRDWPAERREQFAELREAALEVRRPRRSASRAAPRPPAPPCAVATSGWPATSTRRVVVWDGADPRLGRCTGRSSSTSATRCWRSTRSPPRCGGERGDGPGGGAGGRPAGRRGAALGYRSGAGGGRRSRRTGRTGRSGPGRRPDPAASASSGGGAHEQQAAGDAGDVGDVGGTGAARRPAAVDGRAADAATRWTTAPGCGVRPPTSSPATAVEGPLAGWRVGVKDLVAVAGHPTRCGSAATWDARRRGGRRPDGGRAARGRRPRRRGHEAARVRVRHHRDQPGLRDAAEPGRAGPGAGGIVVGIGGGGGGRGGRPGGGDRYRRIGAHPRCALRGGRLQAVAGGAADRRRRRPVAHARSRRVPGR